MIDSNGNKITGEEPPRDMNFLLAEARFLMKGFRMEKSERLAMNAAQNINAYLEAGGDEAAVLGIVEELERSLPQSSDESFVWELVYIRGKILSGLGDSRKNADRAAGCAVLYAEHLGVVCRINPSAHNLCCKARGFAVASSKLADAGRQDEAKVFSETAMEVFLRVEEDDDSFYWETGRLVYYHAFINADTSRENEGCRFGLIERVVHFARRSYLSDRSEFNLNYLATVYLEYTQFERYSFADGGEELIELIDWVEKDGSAPGRLSALKKVLRKHRTGLK